MSDSPKIIEVVMHDVLREDFTRWLESRGLKLKPSPFAKENDDDMDTWFVMPSEATFRSLPLHRTEAGYPHCSTCDGGGCPDCTDPA